MHPKKIAVVTFGGGARDDKTLSLGGQKIPHLLTELAPQSTFFAQIVTRGILRRYVATAHGRRQIAEVV